MHPVCWTFGFHFEQLFCSSKNMRFNWISLFHNTQALQTSVMKRNFLVVWFEAVNSLGLLSDRISKCYQPEPVTELPGNRLMREASLHVFPRWQPMTSVHVYWSSPFSGHPLAGNCICFRCKDLESSTASKWLTKSLAAVLSVMLHTNVAVWRLSMVVRRSELTAEKYSSSIWIWIDVEKVSGINQIAKINHCKWRKLLLFLFYSYITTETIQPKLRWFIV